MELWIRSKNRLSLTKVNSVVIDYNDQKKIIANYMEFNGDEDYIPLGEYDTEERALEVLDEIQRLITDLQYMSYAIPNDKFTGYRPNVYEMPID